MIKKGKIFPYTRRWARRHGLIMNRWELPSKRLAKQIDRLVKQGKVEVAVDRLSEFYGMPDVQVVTGQEFKRRLREKGMVDTVYWYIAESLVDDITRGKALAAYEAFIYEKPTIIVQKEYMDKSYIIYHEFMHLVAHYQPLGARKSEEEVIAITKKFADMLGRSVTYGSKGS